MPRSEPTPLSTDLQVGDIYEQLRRIIAQLGEGGVLLATSATRPSQPAIGDVIYETDTSSLLQWDGFGWRLPWNQPWGRVGDTKVTTQQTGLSTGSDIGQMAVQFIATKDRRYEVSASVPMLKHGVGFTALLLVDGGGTTIAQWIGDPADGANLTGLIPQYEWVATTSGLVTLKLQIAMTIGTVDIAAFPSRPAWLHVDDIGPASAQVAPLPQGVVPGPSPGVLAVIVTTPTSTSTILAGASVAIGAAAQPDPGQTITSVEFFLDGASLGIDATGPYATSWTATAGTHAITARVTQSDGKTLTSPSIAITVTTSGGGGGGPPPTGLPPKLTVQGALLKTSTGVTTTLRGVNQYIVPAYADSSNQMGPLTNWFDTNLPRVADDWVAKGVNCVRMPVMKDTNVAYTNRVKAAVNTLGQRGIYVIVTAFDPVTFGGWPTVSTTNNVAVSSAQFLTTLWTACGKPANLMLELWHEPVGTALTAAQWQSGAQAGIAQLRAVGASSYDGPIFITTRNWGWTFDGVEAAAIRASDPNVVFGSHRFAVSSPTAAPLAATDPSGTWKPTVADAAASAGVAMFVASWGIYNGGYGVGGSQAGNAQGWGAAMATEIQNAVGRGQCVGEAAWMWLWGAMDVGEDDQNSMVDPAWQTVVSGTAWTTNAWGAVVYGLITGLGGAAPPPPNPTAPTVTMSAPSSATTGNVITMTATASPVAGQTITQVTFSVDGTVIVNDATAPYSTTWTATTGSHTLTARATQSDAQTATSTVTILVAAGGSAAPLDGWQFQVAGTGFIDGNGNPLILRGVAQYLVTGNGDDALTNWFTGHMGVVATDWKQKGVNMVRMPLPHTLTAGFYNELKAKVDALWAQGIMSMICAFSGWGAYNSNAAPDDMLTVWQGIGSPRYCAIETNNEPSGITAAQWQSGMDNWRSRLRAGGYKGPIFMGARDWSWTYDSTESKALRNNDTNPGGKAGNVCIVNHRYAVTDPAQPVQGPTDGTTWKGLWPDVAGPDGVAFFMNEWGPWNGGSISPGAYGTGGSYSYNVNTWGESMRQAIQNAVQAGHMAGAAGWMWAWSDPNTMTDANPESGTTSYIQGTSGPPWTLNAWGQKMFSMVSTLAGTPALPGNPTVTHSAPSTAQTGNSVTITASPVAGGGTVTITKVELLIDAVVISALTGPNYSWGWIATTGTHTIQVRATQSDGKTALSTSTNIVVTTTTPPSGGAGLLHVSGRLLKDANNNTVFLKGVNQYHFTPYQGSGVDSLFTWFDANRDRVAIDWQQQGIKAVRLPMLINDLSTSYKDWVKRVCDSLMTRGIYAVPVCFENFNDDYSTGAATQRANVFLAHWNYQGKPAMLMCNLWNEPNNSSSGWRAATEAARSTLRAGGYTAPIFFDAMSWATVNGGTNGNGDFTAIVANDAAYGGNCVFSQHRYHALCSSGYLPTNWATSTGNGGWNSNGVAWVYGEYGWHNCYNDPSNAPAFLQDITTAIINAKAAGQCAGAWPWMWTWADENAIVQPSYWQIQGGAAWNYSSFWGQAAVRLWQNT